MNTMKYVTAIAIMITATFAQADILACEGRQTVLQLTDGTDSEGDRYVLAQVWSKEFQKAKFADLFEDSLQADPGSVGQIVKQKGILSQGYYGGSIDLDLSKKSLKITTKKGYSITEKISCKLQKYGAINFDTGN